MSELQEQELPNTELSRSNLIGLGAVIGALAGAGAGYVLSQRLKEEENLQLTARDGLTIGGALLALFKQIANLGK
jgi:drug/metabolite transporter (DMT)-like permease